MHKIYNPTAGASHISSLINAIENLFPNKQNISAMPTYHKGIASRPLSRGIYVKSGISFVKFIGIFTTEELFANLQLRSDFYNEIAIVRNFKLPDGDTPNGFSEVEKESYRRINPSYIEADDHFRFGFISSVTHLPAFYDMHEKGCPNFLFNNLSTKRENFTTFHKITNAEMQKSLQKAFEAVARFYYGLAIRHKNVLHLDLLDK